MKLTDFQKDALKELINIGAGKAAGVLNTMLQTPITLNVPEVRVLSSQDVDEELMGTDDQIASVHLPFSGPISGKTALVFPSNSAIKLVSVLTGEDVSSPDLETLREGTLNEVGNIVVNGVMGSISNVLSQDFQYSIPVYSEGAILNLIPHNQKESGAVLLVAQTNFSIKELEIEGHIILFFDIVSFDSLLQAIEKVNT